MKLLKFKIRTLLIFLAIFAPILVVVVWLLKLSQALDEMYGQEGLLQRRQNFYAEITAGSNALKSGQFAIAERRYSSSLKMIKSSKNYKFIHDPIGDEVVSLLGLGDALAGQGRLYEAETNYNQALTIRSQWFGKDHPAIVEISDRLKITSTQKKSTGVEKSIRN